MTATPGRGASSSRALAFWVLIGVVGYVAIDVALAFLRRDFSLVHNAESDYGRGRDGWLMDLNFVLRGAFSGIAVLALRRSRPAVSSWCLWLLGTWALCSVLLAFFPDNPPGYSHWQSGSIHLALAFVAFTAIVISAIAIASARPSAASPAWVRPAAFLTSGLGVVAYLALPRTLNRTRAPGGLVERIFLAAELAWLVIMMVSVVHNDRRESTASVRGPLIAHPNLD